ncbi:MAG: PilZ domain-containing protein [Candidatus Methylomirabilales bacterium]
MKKRRKKRRKNRSTSDSVALEEGGVQLTLDSVAAAVDGGATDSEAANGSGIKGADQEAGEPEAAVGEAAASEAEGPAEASDGEAAATETGEPEATAPEDAELEVVAAEVAEDADGGSPELEAAVRKAAERAARDRRQHARFVVGGRTKGRVTAIYDARILDISPGGSLIEHSQVVRPGTLSCLDLELLGKRMSLKCRVARSVVHRSEVQPDGDNELIYHTGLEFLDRSDETRKLIIDYIQSIIEDGNKP